MRIVDEGAVHVELDLILFSMTRQLLPVHAKGMTGMTRSSLAVRDRFRGWDAE